MNDGPCRCKDDGRLCNTCAEREFSLLHQRCTSDPACSDDCQCSPALDRLCDQCIRRRDAPRPEGRERYIGSQSYRQHRSRERREEGRPGRPGEWASISERLSRIAADDAALDALAQRLLDRD